MDDWEALGEDDIVLPVRPAREPDADPTDWTTASTEAAPKTDAREQVAVKKDLSEPRPMIIVDMTVMERVPRAHRALCAHSCRLPRVDPAHVATAFGQPKLHCPCEALRARSTRRPSFFLGALQRPAQRRSFLFGR